MLSHRNARGAARRVLLLGAAAVLAIAPACGSTRSARTPAASDSAAPTLRADAPPAAPDDAPGAPSRIAPGTAPAATAAAAAPRVAPGPDFLNLGLAVLSRVVVLGASASHGLSLLGSLADMLGVAIAVEHTPPRAATSPLFFMLDEDARGALVKQAAMQEPSALVALDFLFWYGYGLMPEEQRLPLLERGLAQLDAFACPIVISEFPDMSPAVGLMLLADQVPAPESMAALNARVRQWAAERPRVILVPLSDALAQMRAGSAITVGALTFPSGDDSRYLLPDKLHPTPEGLVVLACLVTEGLRARIGGLQATDFVSDPAALLAAFTQVTQGRRPRVLF